MVKSKKPTTQELYEARKQREEEEKVAFLPPGLINHGNTCFMNSVLQGFIATSLLYNMVHFQPIPSSIQNASVASPILASRSPQLTNGHGLGGGHEKEWVEGMALGDVFVKVMEKAWDIQNERKREQMSPKELLSAIGRKYDQYLDFRQQDAHEFLSHLLDAIRMEELDVIKQRQPPPTKKKRRRSSKQPAASSSTGDTASSRAPQFRTSLSPVLEGSNSGYAPPEVMGDTQPPTSPSLSPEETLATFSDMLFGGQLASILVCEKCKHISCTYEDFNDLSLSIKPEDYARERKRDKLKTLAKKLRLRPSTASGIPRSSSVPASPVRRSSDQGADHEPVVEEQHVRRRSIDATPGVKELPGSGLRNAAADAEFDASTADGGQEFGRDAEAKQPAQKAPQDREHIEFVEQERSDKDKKEKEKEKEKEDNDWVKLGRRISMSVAMGIGKKDKERRSRSMERTRSTESDRSKSKTKDGEEPASSPAPSMQHFSSAVPPSSAVSIKNREAGPSRGTSPSPNFSASPLVSGSPRLPIIRRAGSPSLISGKQTKTPRPPKLSREESAYLRRLLADVQLSASSSPLAIFRPPSFTGSNPAFHRHGHHHPPASATATAAQNLWAKLGQIPSIEECLRLFTSVEVLDGDNMVGCRRCWKIANGTYQRRSSKTDKHQNRAGIDVEDSETTEESEETSPQQEKTEGNAGPSRSPSASPTVEPVSLPVSRGDVSPTLASQTELLASSPNLPVEMSSPESSTTSLSAQSAQSVQSSTQPDDGASLSSVVATVASYLPPVLQHKPAAISAPLNSSDTPGINRSQSSPSPQPVSEYRGFPVPSISTTAPETPSVSAPAAAAKKPLPSLPQESFGPSGSGDSLSAPPIKYGRSKQEKEGDESESDLDSDTDESGTESDASGSVSRFSDGSPMMSPYASPVMSRENLGDMPRSPAVGLGLNLEKVSNRSTITKNEARTSKIPKSKQVIYRRAYKRYLIATAPAILIIHLKRFQQVSKNPSFSSFSSGFKKLDDFVSFPEYLDLGPYLAPKKEDWGLGNDGAGEKAESSSHPKHRKKCMYRLYAVVMHIGNMLGGHYIAYTALPSARSPVHRDSGSQHSSAGDTVGSDGGQQEGVQSQSQPSQPQSAPPAHEAPRQWAYVSDTVVRLTSLEEVLKAKAYLCMYERI
ncbi:peptidase C19, ubiquitin carboxyl-terminal hydrolase 2 [Neolentinus lepideus HHB14362 ss-1]|uniref:ubiquitinyl hydrolase 1 n=1 Tax=Neolentinus lepideus HHB14362 ss-1 TaxID=1314782 RepID=A0A165UFW3_9AGAM|nr:peptidase C19, ubiquitin carboxyl-terminal hydrolase 2 [Neolentinus lepideus HHB14362 ss-1]